MLVIFIILVVFIRLLKKGNLNLNESLNKVIDACKTNFWKIICSKYSLKYSLWVFYDMGI